MNVHPKCSRFISIVLTFCMVVSLLPTSVLAARNSAGADARSYEDMPLEVSEEMAASLANTAVWNGRATVREREVKNKISFLFIFFLPVLLYILLAIACPLF